MSPSESSRRDGSNEHHVFYTAATGRQLYEDPENSFFCRPAGAAGWSRRRWPLPVYAVDLAEQTRVQTRVQTCAQTRQGMQRGKGFFWSLWCG